MGENLVTDKKQEKQTGHGVSRSQFFADLKKVCSKVTSGKSFQEPCTPASAKK